MQPNASNETFLPRSVRNQLVRVDERVKERAAEAAGTPPAKPDAPASADTGAEPGPTAAAPVPPAPPAPTPPAPPADSRENDPVYWRDRFSVMQGINAKMRTDHAEAMLESNRQIESLSTRMRELEQQAAAKPAGAKDKPDLSLFFTPDQIERFGEDQCEAMARAAITAAGQQAQAIIDAEVKPLKDANEAAKTDKAKEAETAFWNELDRLVPNNVEINAEPAWLEWLAQPDADGEARQKRLSRHRAMRNAKGVANVFADYVATKPKPPVPPVVPGRGAGNGALPETPAAQTNGKGYPSRDEMRDYTKRAATIRNPRDPRFVSKEERAEFDARLRLPKPA